MQHPPPPPEHRPATLDDLGDLLWAIRRHTRICALAAILILIPTAVTALVLGVLILEGLGHTGTGL